MKALFSAALELPREDRAAYLTLEAGGDPALIAEVQSLLDSHEQPGEFLDTVTHEFRSQAFAASGAARSRIGERIGAYRIVGMLGTGGMGDVFKAVRDDDQYHAEVAIKLMRADVRSTPDRAALPDRTPDPRGARPSQHRAAARWRDHGWRHAVRGHGARERASPSTPGAMRATSACATACSSSCRCARP